MDASFQNKDNNEKGSACPSQKPSLFLKLRRPFYEIKYGHMRGSGTGETGEGANNE
jgi:hypothetical protein